MLSIGGETVNRLTDSSDPRHFGTKIVRHWFRTVRRTLQHQSRTAKLSGNFKPTTLQQ